MGNFPASNREEREKEQTMKTVQIGSAVQVLDENGVQHHGIVTNCWPSVAEYDEATGGPAINVVFVSADESKTDCYGRQTEHLSSTMHRNAAGAAACPGRKWWQE